MKKNIPAKKNKQNMPPAKAVVKSSMPLMPQWVWLLLIVILTLFAFSPTGRNDFTNWDDQSYVVNNTLIRSLSIDNIIAIFKTQQVMGNYHPLTILSLAIDYNFFQLTPEGYHIHSLLLHVLSVIVVFFFIQALFKQSFITIITTVLFAIHPMRVESVAWVSERKDQLYVLYYLAGMLAYLFYLDKKKVYYIPLVVLFFILSLLSKGQAVTFPIALFIIDYIRAKKISIKDILLFKIPLITLSVIMGLVAVHAQKASNAINQSVPQGIADRLVMGCYSFTGYITKFFAPINLSAFYPYPDKIAGHYSTDIYLCEIVPLAVAVLAVVALLYKQRAIAGGIAFFYLNIILLVQLLPVGSEIISERYSYLAYTGLFWALAYSVYLLTAKFAYIKPVIITACLIYGVWLTYGCYNRTAVWYSSETLWKDVIEQFPRVPAAQNNLGSYYQKNEDLTNAKIHFDAAIAQQSLYVEAHTNRSDIYRRMGKIDSAIMDVNIALHINENYREAHQNRGIAYAIAGKLDSAMLDFNWILSRFPDDADAHANRGNLNDMLGHIDAALDDYNKSLTLNPTKYDTYGNRAHTLVAKGQYEQAIKDATTALQYFPNNGNFMLTRGNAYNASGHYAEALQDFKHAKSLGIAVSDQLIADLQKKVASK